MKETGADGETVLRALYPFREKLNAQGELSEDDELKLSLKLRKRDARVADNVVRMHRNAMLDMERYVRTPSRGDCEGVPDHYGYKQASPLQIGGAASGSQLFMGAMVCPGNRLPKIHGRTSGDTGAYQRPVADKADLPLDTWKLSCGATDYTVYSDLYTRGRFCAPKGFVVMPLRAREAYNLSWSAYKEKKYEDALSLVNEAIDRGGSVAEFLEHRAFIQMELGKIKAARTSFRAAIKASPKHDSAALNWARFEFHNGSPRQAEKALARALTTASEGHENYRRAWCLAAENNTKLSTPKRRRGLQMAEQGCASKQKGNERCCKLSAAKAVDAVRQ